MDPESLKALIRTIPDFPAPGILFRDITPLLADSGALRKVVGIFADRFSGLGIEVVAGIEARGFMFATPVALALGAGFVPIRKLGRLPAPTLRREYALEYGTSQLEVHADAIRPGQRVLLLDDVLATGGTAGASASLIQELGGEVVAAAFLIELVALGGRERLQPCAVDTILTY